MFGSKLPRITVYEIFRKVGWAACSAISAELEFSNTDTYYHKVAIY